MTKLNNSVEFTALLGRVLEQWPLHIDTSSIIIYDNSPDLYTVVGLTDLGDRIAENFDSDSDSVLVTTLNDAITSTVRLASRFCKEVNTRAIREVTVRQNFEERLHRAEINKDLGWEENDIQLIKRYFHSNKQ